MRPDAIPTSITEEALTKLIDYDWPGNVRELENAIERAVVLARGNADHGRAPAVRRPHARRAIGADWPTAASRLEDEAEADAAPSFDGGRGRHRAGRRERPRRRSGSFKEQVAALEKQLIREALERAGGNRTKAAEELGIYRRLLYAKIKEYGLE